MKRIIIINGLIAGVIVSLMFAISYPLTHNGTLSNESSMVVGYISMVIALSLVFVGIKSYRDQHQKGVITFGRGFVVGILITLIASVMYASTWEIYYNTVASDFMEKYTTSYLEKMKQEGASDAEIAQQRTEMEEFGELYKKPRDPLRCNTFRNIARRHSHNTDQCRLVAKKRISASGTGQRTITSYTKIDGSPYI